MTTSAAAVRGGPVSGWRVFGVSRDGELLPPFVSHYWQGRLLPEDVWRDGLNIARCLDDAGHRAPEAGCTCGIRATTDLRQLLQACTERQFLGSARSILQECGVLARIRLQGYLLPGVNVPTDDPPTTVRGAAGTLLEVHLSRERAAVLQEVVRRYPAARVTVTEDLLRLHPESDLLEELSEQGFGTLDLTWPRDRAAVQSMARSLVSQMHQGLTASDAAVVLFDSAATPTMREAEGFVDAVTRHLAPELADLPDGRLVGRSVPLLERLARSSRRRAP